MDLMVSENFDLSVITQDKVVALEHELLKMPQAEIITEHIFEEGKYLRRITVPPWVVLTGAAHKTAYRVRLEKGTIAVNVGDVIKVLVAPLEFDAPEGVQRAGRVFDEEVIWTDIYDNPDDCRDIPTLEDRLYVVPEYGLGASRTDEQKALLNQMYPDNPSYMLTMQEGE